MCLHCWSRLEEGEEDIEIPASTETPIREELGGKEHLLVFLHPALVPKDPAE